MKIKMLFISFFTFVIPLLTPYGLWILSYADPFLILRDLIMDSVGTKRKLFRLWRIFLIGIALVIVFFVFKKDKLAIISAICSITSETLDFLLTTKFWSLKRRATITVICNIFDTCFFMILAISFQALNQLDYNIFIDTFLLSCTYLVLFFFAAKSRLFKDYYRELQEKKTQSFS
jgi:hypothetical protein